MKLKLPILLLSMTSACAFAGKQHLINSLDFVATLDDSGESISTRVINGSDASISDFPYYAGLILTDTDLKHNTGSFRFSHYCGASILDRNHILTAAHCLEDLDYNSIRNQGVVINTDDYEATSVSNVFPMEEVYLYGDYDPYLVSHDIAVIKLSSSLPVDVETISIASDSERNRYNNISDTPDFTIVGYGYIDDNKNGTTKLQRAELSNIGDSACQIQVLNTYGITFVPELQTCILPKNLAPDVNTGSCNGDSGGPLSYFDNVEGKYKQVALTSFGHIESCSKVDAPQVFSEVKGYSNWINNIINGTPYNYTKIDRNNSIIEEVNEGDDGSGGSIPLFSLISLGLLSLFRRKIKR